jgi:hypothetical protein
MGSVQCEQVDTLVRGITNALSPFGSNSEGISPHEDVTGLRQLENTLSRFEHQLGLSPDEKDGLQTEARVHRVIHAVQEVASKALGRILPSDTSLSEGGTMQELRSHIAQQLEALSVLESLGKLLNDVEPRRLSDERHSMQSSSIALDSPLAPLNLSVRCRNRLVVRGVVTVGDLIKMTRDELLSLPGFGETTLRELENKLRTFGLELAPSEISQSSDLRYLPLPSVGSDWSYGSGVTFSALGGDSSRGLHDTISLDSSIGALQLGLRCRSRLVIHLGARTVGDVVTKTAAELLALPGFGQTSLRELETQLWRWGFSLSSPESSPEWGVGTKRGDESTGFDAVTANRFRNDKDLSAIVSLKIAETLLREGTKQYLAKMGIETILDLLPRGLTCIDDRNVRREVLELYNALGIPANPFDASRVTQLGSSARELPTVEEVQKGWEWFASLPQIALRTLRTKGGSLRRRRFKEGDSLKQDRMISIFEARFLEPAQRISLEELGKRFSITRERVRQISEFAKTYALTEVQGELCTHYVALRRRLEADGGILDTALTGSTPVAPGAAHLINELFARANAPISYDARLGTFIGLKEGLCEVLLKEMRAVPQAMKGVQIQFSREQIQGLLSDSFHQVLAQNPSSCVSSAVEKLKEHLIEGVLREDYLLVGEDTFESRSLSAGDRVLYAFKKLYPHGARLYQDLADIVEALRRECSHLENVAPNYALSCLVMHRDLIWLWGRGTYIHRDNVTLSDEAPDVVRNIIHPSILSLFDEGIDDFNVRKVWKIFQPTLERIGIPSREALYTIMREYPHEEIVIRDFPRVSRKDSPFVDMSIPDLMYEFLRASGGEMVKHDFFSHFLRNLGFSTATFQHFFKNRLDVLVDEQSVLLKEILTINESALTKLKELLANGSGEGAGTEALERGRAEDPELWRSVAGRDLSVAMMKMLVERHE